MEMFVVTAAKAEFYPGARLKLAPEQLRGRKHNLGFIKDGVFEVIHPIEFKTGETIGVAGEVDKRVLDSVTKAKDAAKTAGDEPPRREEAAAEAPADAEAGESQGFGKKGKKGKASA